MIAHHDQESLLAVIAFDDEPGGCITAAELLPLEAWDAHYRALFEKLRAFVRRFKTSPREHLLDVVEDLALQKPDSADIYREIYGSLCQTWSGGINREHVYNRAQLHGRVSRLRQGIGDALQLLKSPAPSEDQVARAELALEQVRKTNAVVMDTGVSSHNVEAMMEVATEPEPEPFPIGIPELDAMGFGLVPGELLMLAGAYGTGKSWGLLNIGFMAAMLSDLKVLYLPLEMKQKQATKRLLQMAFGYGNRDEEVEILRLVKDHEGRVGDFDTDVLRIPGLYNPEHHSKLRRQVQNFRRRAEIRIAAWPSGRLNLRKLEAQLDMMEAEDGFVPDVVIPDYLGIMEIKDPKAKRLELGQYVVDFRGMADERNFSAASAVQINRSGANSNDASGTSIAEDFSAAFTADRLGIYNQSPIEKELGLARIKPDKSRNDASVGEVLITQCYAAGRYRMESALVTSSYAKLMEEKAQRHES